MLDGRLATTATDEYTTFKGPKLWGDRIATVCGGHNGIETRLPVAFTKFVSERGLSLRRFVDITSANAAKIMGYIPEGQSAGSDADLCLIDRTEETISLSDLMPTGLQHLGRFCPIRISGDDHFARQSGHREWQARWKFNRGPLGEAACHKRGVSETCRLKTGNMRNASRSTHLRFMSHWDP
jgi:hypothetical protein